MKLKQLKSKQNGQLNENVSVELKDSSSNKVTVNADIGYFNASFNSFHIDSGKYDNFYDNVEKYIEDKQLDWKEVTALERENRAVIRQQIEETRQRLEQLVSVVQETCKAIIFEHMINQEKQLNELINNAVKKRKQNNG